jgi:hypothetical protein
MRKESLLTALAGLMLLSSAGAAVPSARAENRNTTTASLPPVQVVLDGRRLHLDPAPTIVDGRTLVPVRGLLEAMGATLSWDGSTRTVTAVRGDRFARLRIDRRLACLNEGCVKAAVLDVPARILQDRTFVPVRFISQALGAKVTWDEARRTVFIDTTRPADPQPAPVSLPDIAPGTVIRGTVQLRAEGPSGKQVRFLLINPATGAGPIVAGGTDTRASYAFVPSPAETGTRLLVAAIRDATGTWRYSDPVPVELAPAPQVRLTGVQPNAAVEGPIGLSTDLNFLATHVHFQLLDASGKAETLNPDPPAGPGETLTWYPQPGHNGDRWLKAIAYDITGKAYESPVVPIRVQVSEKTVFTSIQEGAVLTRPLWLRTSVNYPVEAVRYILDGQTLGWGYNLWWEFGPDQNGPHTLLVEVQGKDGNLRTVGPIHFTIKTSPVLWLSGVGPRQVVTGPLDLKAAGNIPLEKVEFFLVDERGQTTSLGSRAPGEKLTWTPKTNGSFTVYAVGRSAAGQTVTSDKVAFRVYLGTTYGPKALMSKEAFKETASRLAVSSYQETGMAASLQVAQAILETGWGQSVPVDKYTGKLSYNLFGIKALRGAGPAGTIISNTWEEYNGVAYRVDAEFRAYHSVEESWKDHKSFLLEGERYAPFRAVMANPVLGAWALRRTGYATDSRYPVKLINLMKQYDLFRLDQIEL